MPSKKLFCVTLCLIPFTTAYAQQPSRITVQQTPEGLTAHIDDETLHLIVCQPTVIHVIAGPGNPSTQTNPATQPWITPNSCPGAKFAFAQDDKAATLTTSAVKVSLSLKSRQPHLHPSRRPTRQQLQRILRHPPRRQSGPPHLRARRRQQRADPPRHRPLPPRHHRSLLRPRPAPVRCLQLPRLCHRTRPEQHRHRHPPAPLHQGLRHPLEHRLLHLLR